MKLGILTFHSQQNYGGVLQCWALKQVLEGMGHSVVVIDKWMDDSRSLLLNQFARYGLKEWIEFLIRLPFRYGDFGCILRTFRTMQFVRKLGLTKYHFVNWKDAPKSLDLDLVVVGSDQVWNPNWKHTRQYLMKEVEGQRRVAYAASFGVAEIPDAYKEYYRGALNAFSAISCREAEGVRICKRLGFEGAVHVADPTILLNPELWNKFLLRKKYANRDANKRKLVCYFLSEDVESALSRLRKFAEAERCEVVMFTNCGFRRRFPRSFNEFKRNFARLPNVRIYNSAGPIEFVREFSSADWVITDSFHALMFSEIFHCNVRFLRPVKSERKQMFARIEEFGREYINGEFLANDVNSALGSIQRGEENTFDVQRINKFRELSRMWLMEALRG